MIMTTMTLSANEIEGLIMQAYIAGLAIIVSSLGLIAADEVKEKVFDLIMILFNVIFFCVTLTLKLSVI